MKKETKTKSTSAKSLFDHINALTVTQKEDYFKTLTSEDKKSWNTYMINKYLSMDTDFIEIISYMDRYTVAKSLSPELVYLAYIEMFPKGKRYLKYVKSNKSEDFKQELVDLVSVYYECSKSEATEYLYIYKSMPNGIDIITNILNKLGIVNNKDVKKILW